MNHLIQPLKAPSEQVRPHIHRSPAVPSLAAVRVCCHDPGSRVIPVFLSCRDKFSRGKHRLLLPGRGMQEGSRQRQTYLQVTWLQHDTAAVWPLMTGRRAGLTHRPTNSAAVNLFVPARSVHACKRPWELCVILEWVTKAKTRLLSSLGAKYVLTGRVGVTSAASCNETAKCWLTCCSKKKQASGRCIFFFTSTCL